jgi:hypothetical protein
MAHASHMRTGSARWLAAEGEEAFYAKSGGDPAEIALTEMCLR